MSVARRADVWYATVIDDSGSLVACNFSRDQEAATKSVTEWLPNKNRRNLVLFPEDPKVIDVLHRIYEGQSIEQLPSLVLPEKSEFLRKVYETTVKIPIGKVTTYGMLAEIAGSRTLSRAVGNAMARNPLPLVVPCHRVVPSTLEVGNYGGAGASKREGSRIKHDLLVREGVLFNGNRVLEKCVWEPQ